MRWRDVATISRLPHSEGRNGSPAPPDLGAHISMSKASQFELQKTGSFPLPEAPRACAVQTAAPTFSRQARPLLPTFGFVRCCRSTGNLFRFGFLLLGYFKKPKIIPSTKRPSFIETFDFPPPSGALGLARGLLGCNCPTCPGGWGRPLPSPTRELHPRCS